MIAFQECCKRGWSHTPYSALLTLLDPNGDDDQFSQLWPLITDKLLKLLLFSSVAYTTVLLSLVGTSALIAMTATGLSQMVSQTKDTNSSADIYLGSRSEIGDDISYFSLKSGQIKEPRFELTGLLSYEEDENINLQPIQRNALCKISSPSLYGEQIEYLRPSGNSYLSSPGLSSCPHSASRFW